MFPNFIKYKNKQRDIRFIYQSLADLMSKYQNGLLKVGQLTTTPPTANLTQPTSTPCVDRNTHKCTFSDTKFL